MQVSALNLRNKIELINSIELRKDLLGIKTIMEKKLEEVEIIIKDAENIRDRNNGKLSNIFIEYKNYVLNMYELTINNQFSFQSYITKIGSEITTYADGIYYPTEEERQEKRNEMVIKIFEELANI